ncbi:hypothetical protein GGTG_06553 [Gaeumannomyces tritici R3-111a-1]|uniref:RING-type domain-containing protein n=1 Tax=Gaeumannomyces tritici (strain R3-111a-1) TaxID=644352 RepID=J3NZ53_GAET3|nr:hypothetical protein GGTG_06553 [Gaeumannomyces tritici R3-111a-1]EJT76636.1 hypothetical protein GGTG_06553 [Gaeumannomyces tritici R3-111a-1]
MDMHAHKSAREHAHREHAQRTRSQRTLTDLPENTPAKMSGYDRTSISSPGDGGGTRHHSHTDDDAAGTWIPVISHGFVHQNLFVWQPRAPTLPPTLPPILPPIPPPVRDITQPAEEIAYLPSLRRWLLDSHTLQAMGAPTGPTPFAKCSICRLARLDIAELRPPPALPHGPAALPSEEEEEEEEDDDDDDHERAVVLFCGHMFGRKCLTSWLTSQLGSGGEYGCPVCKANVCYGSWGRADGCSHHVPGLDIDDCGGVLAVPRTRDEGGRLPDRCDRCRVMHDPAVVGWGNRDVADGIRTRPAALWQPQAGSLNPPSAAVPGYPRMPLWPLSPRIWIVEGYRNVPRDF